MKIQSILIRAGGTKTDIDGILYHFEPLTDGAHVAEVTLEKHIDRFLSISEGFKVYHGDLAPQGKPEALPVTIQEQILQAPRIVDGLAGSTVHDETYMINGVEYFIGDIVTKAQAASNLTAEEWNDLDDEDRHARIDMALDDLAEAEPEVQAADDITKLVEAYIAKFGKKPHYRKTAETLKAEREAA